MNDELILILDFGGQYNQLIARRIRECGVYCEVLSWKTPDDEIIARHPNGIIFTGGPNSVYAADAPRCSRKLLEAGIPLLGICYGAQLMAYLLDGTVSHAPVSEYGKTVVTADSSSALFSGIPKELVTWMSHTDYISSVPEGFRITAHTGDCPAAAMEDAGRKLYAVQFHPEVVHTRHGKEILRNFAIDICGCSGTWEMSSFVTGALEDIRAKVGDRRVLCALSGGVDSSVAAVLLSRAIGKQLTCVFIDHGLLRKDEADQIEAIFGPDGPYDLNFVRLNASDRFLTRLAGVTEPERKRKIIGEEFIRSFESLSLDGGCPELLAQGTIYPDVIESGLGSSATIKSHHNVGGLPEHMKFEGIIEPLKMLFKDEVRQVGLQLGLPRELVFRQPFPGPGLGVRIVGEVTREKIRIVQEADAIFREEIARAGWDAKLNQYFAALTDMRSVGVMGDERTYDYAVALRAVITDDFMTANAARLPWDLLDRVTSRIVNEVQGVNRVFYDCTGKPPATIELE